MKKPLFFKPFFVLAPLLSLLLLFQNCTEFTALKSASITSGSIGEPLDPDGTFRPDERVRSLLALRFGFGAQTRGGADGIMTEITSLDDETLLTALTDDIPRWIYFHPSLNGRVWSVPEGTTALGAKKTIDGRGVNIIWQYGDPNHDLSIVLPPLKIPEKTGQLNASKGELIMTGITHVGNLGWPYVYQAPYFKNGAADGLEIWGGTNYWIHNNKWMRMSDESLGVYHLNGGIPDMITFSNNVFLETKTASLIGNADGARNGHITIAYNLYNTMVNGRSPGEFRSMNAHVYNNVIGYVNDEGIRVGRNGRVISEYNVFDIGCNPDVSGPRAIRTVLSAEMPLGILYALGDIISQEAQTCPFTENNGYITDPSPLPFTIPYTYSLIKSRDELLKLVGTPR